MLSAVILLGLFLLDVGLDLYLASSIHQLRVDGKEDRKDYIKAWLHLWTERSFKVHVISVILYTCFRITMNQQHLDGAAPALVLTFCCIRAMKLRPLVRLMDALDGSASDEEHVELLVRYWPKKRTWPTTCAYFFLIMCVVIVVNILNGQLTIQDGHLSVTEPSADPISINASGQSSAAQSLANLTSNDAAGCGRPNY